MDFRNKLVFIPGKPFQPSLMSNGAYPSQLHSKVGSWPYPQTLD
jgi:hypothetical protein